MAVDGGGGGGGVHGVDLGGLATRVLGVGVGSWRGLAKQFPRDVSVLAHPSLKQTTRPVRTGRLGVGVGGSRWIIVSVIGSVGSSVVMRL